MKNLTLSARFILSFGLLLFAVGVLLGIIALEVGEMRDHAASLGHELAPALVEAQELTGELGKALDRASSYALTGRTEHYDNWTKTCKTVEGQSAAFIKQLGDSSRLRGFQPKMQAVLREFEQFKSGLEELKKLSDTQDAEKQALWNRLITSGDSTLEGLADISRGAAELTERVMASNERAVRRITLAMLVGLPLTLILALWLAFRLLKGTARPLSGLLGRFSHAASEVTGTAGHLSRSSNNLAQGAAENTSAVLEAVSSLEEMLTMAKRNAGHSNEASGLMNEVKGHVREANEAMSEISTAMEEIRQSGEASSQIIKTVEEIAFQTNILALNAAVEAARAGEAGVGFAVVADEVRNLANRSAEAAKNTAVMIAGSMERINQGANLVREAEANFDSMVAASDQMVSIVGEIAQASQSQAQDVQNIHQSIAQVDKVTQENAAGAAETKALSGNLLQEAARLEEALSEMSVIVAGSGTVPQSLNGSPKALKRRAPVSAVFPSVPSVTASVKSKAEKSALDAAIPMDDDF